jgi:hypothetical protein
MNTPVLFIIFNRPECTKAVFAQIRKVKPKQLFIAADGPRASYPNDFELCLQTRKIIEKIDWECDVKTLFRDENLGCGKAISEAITWFFTFADTGIILEDDCLPHPTFFRFCEEMLKKYRDNQNVFNISGSNFQFGKKRGDGSYYFSKYGHTWGWATWRRAWLKFDPNMKDYNEFRNKLNIEQYWIDVFDKTYFDKPNIWGYQWFYQMQKNKAKAVVPNSNLIYNIGFDTDATHTQSKPHWHKFYKLDDGIATIEHPTNCEINNIADEFMFNILFKNPDKKYVKLINFCRRLINPLIKFKL